jgi:hypothetical protein
MLQADPKVKAAMAKPAAKKPAAKKPGAAPAGGAMGAMVQQLGGDKPANTMANAPVSKTNTAKPGNPNAAPAAEPAAAPAAAPAAKTKAPAAAPAAGEQPAPAPKKRAAPKKKAAPSQAEIDADRERLMGPTSDSIIRKGNLVAESFSFFRKK